MEADEAGNDGEAQRDEGSGTGRSPVTADVRTWWNIRTWPGLCRLAHDTAGGKAGDREQPGVLGLCRRIRRTKTQFPQSDQFDVKAPPSVNQTITASQNVYERDVKPYVEINSCVRLLVSH